MFRANLRESISCRVKVRNSFRAGPTTRLAVVCGAASHAGMQPDMRKPSLLTNMLHVVEIAVVPCFIVMLWKAASLPAEGTYNSFARVKNAIMAVYTCLCNLCDLVCPIT